MRVHSHPAVPGTGEILGAHQGQQLSVSVHALLFLTALALIPSSVWISSSLKVQFLVGKGRAFFSFPSERAADGEPFDRRAFSPSPWLVLSSKTRKLCSFDEAQFPLSFSRWQRVCI